jgi:hypothetical protein
MIHSFVIKRLYTRPLPLPSQKKKRSFLSDATGHIIIIIPLACTYIENTRLFFSYPSSYSYVRCQALSALAFNLVSPQLGVS